jgi:hypothetical protein
VLPPDPFPTVGTRPATAPPGGPLTAPTMLLAPHRTSIVMPRRRVLRNVWRAFVVVTGALVLVVCSGMALGIVTVGPDGLGLDLGGPAGAKVPGVDGVYPGGSAVQVPVVVRNENPAGFEVTRVEADLSGLPARCPAASWRLFAPGLLPTLSGRSEVTLALPVGLSEDAPDSCQGLTARLPVRVRGLRHPSPTSSPSARSAGSAGALVPDTLDGQAVVTVATLGTPTASLAVRGSQIGVLAGRPSGGPAPSGYDVIDVTGTGRTTLCSATATGCADRSAGPAADRSYLVRARLGRQWVRDSAPVRGWTPPPRPLLEFSAGGRSPAFGLQAGAAAGDYEVALSADGASTPFRTVRVPAGSDLGVTVAGPAFGAGTHRVVAVAQFRGWRVPSATVRLTVAPSGRTTAQISEPPAAATPDPGLHPVNAPWPVEVAPGPSAVGNGGATGAGAGSANGSTGNSRGSGSSSGSGSAGGSGGTSAGGSGSVGTGAGSSGGSGSGPAPQAPAPAGPAASVGTLPVDVLPSASVGGSGSARGSGPVAQPVAP